MFFKATVLKRMLKAAYKGAGLTVGHSAEGADGGSQRGFIFLPAGGCCGSDLTRCRRKRKRRSLRYAGIFRGEGEVFKAVKDMGNQYEIEQREVFNLPATFKRCKTTFRVTKLLGQQGDNLIRFLQEDGGGNRVTAVSEIFIDLIDPEAINREGGEYEPFGPVAESAGAPFMLWGNNTCYLMAGVRLAGQDKEEAEFWKHLEGTEII